MLDVMGRRAFNFRSSPRPAYASGFGGLGLESAEAFSEGGKRGSSSLAKDYIRIFELVREFARGHPSRRLPALSRRQAPQDEAGVCCGAGENSDLILRNEPGACAGRVSRRMARSSVPAPALRDARLR